ncbi:MAG TPA: methyltransferase domain-containing protein [Candidatus Acidoferrales bacterium]|nr:methyltransferase domain-containing protein [Candidatus Acidoferrales bacterium]
MHYHPDKFYRQRDAATRSSAEAICPLVLQWTAAKSVIDVGCGVGTWLDVFQKLGVGDVFGVEGHWVDKKHLVIPEELFARANLEEPFKAARTFDLAISLEVAEHLPAQSAGAFVGSLVGLAPAVLFSAAIPGQGGTHHVNEQWPEYWARLFEDCGYAVIDCIRREVWQNPRVLWWYAQNTLLFVQKDRVASYPLLAEAARRTARSQLALVHPSHYASKCQRLAKLEEQASRLQEELTSVRRTFKALTRNAAGALGLKAFRARLRRRTTATEGDLWTQNR